MIYIIYHIYHINYIYIKFFWSNVSFKASVSLLIFCLNDLSINGMLKSPIIVVLLLISPFMLVNICFIYLGTPMLGAYIFIILISSWIDPLIITQCPSLSLITVFVL